MRKQARGGQDPLSAASAGLLALGIERLRRGEVLELLSAMLDLADLNGNVRLERPLYAVEERLGIDESLEAYTWLEQLGVVARTNSGWRIANIGAHVGPAGDTLASMQVLRRHLATVGADANDIVPLPVCRSAEPEGVVPIKRWRRAAPMAAAGIAASVAIVAGVSQFVPQAAVTGRNAALHAAVPTSTVKGASGATRRAVRAARGSAAPIAEGVALSPSPVVVTPTAGALASSVACVAPRVIAAVTSVDVVPLALAGDRGQTTWAAVVKGTATLADSSAAVLLPGLSVVGHVLGRDTETVMGALGAPVLLPGTATPFSAVISLGDTKPTSPVTASAAAASLETCP